MSLAAQGVPSPAECGFDMGDVRRSLTVHAEMVRLLLPEFDQVSITVVGSTGDLATWAHAGDLVTVLDRLQYGLGEGPCLDSLRAVGAVVAPHIQSDDRWRRYVAAAGERGLRSQIAAPLRWRDGKPLGALNMYSTTRGHVAVTAPLVAEALAVQIGGALTSLREIENLHRALTTRTTIGMAVGLLMAQYQLTEAAAIAVLRRRSSYANVKLRDIAAQMVSEGEAGGLEPLSS